MNKVIIIGHLGADPEIRHTNGGTSVSNFNLATSEKWEDEAGGKKERTEWHRVVAWGKLAEICAQYLKKGSQCMVEGKMQTRSWEDKDGTKRYTTEIVASNVQFLGSPSGKREQDLGPGSEGDPNDYFNH